MNKIRARLLTEDRRVLVENLEVWLEVTDAANRKWAVQFGQLDDAIEMQMSECFESLEFLRLEFEDGRNGTIGCSFGVGGQQLWTCSGISPLYDR